MQQNSVTQGGMCPTPQVMQLVSEVWQKDGLIKKTDSPFLREAARILKNSLELVTDADKQLRELLDYPLAATLAEDEKAQAVLDDNFTEASSLPHETVHIPVALRQAMQWNVSQACCWAASLAATLAEDDKAQAVLDDNYTEVLSQHQPTIDTMSVGDRPLLKVYALEEHQSGAQ